MNENEKHCIDSFIKERSYLSNDPIKYSESANYIYALILDPNSIFVIVIYNKINNRLTPYSIEEFNEDFGAYKTICNCENTLLYCYDSCAKEVLDHFKEKYIALEIL